MRGFAGTWLSGVVLSGALVSSALGLNDVAPVEHRIDSTVATPGVLEIHVIDHRGEPVEVRVRGCRDDVYPSARVRLETGRSCTIEARRKDGAFWTPWTAPVTATTGHIAVDLQDWTQGGLGVRVSAVAQGAYVQSVESGSPGRRVGLEPGDILAAAGGVPLDGLTVDEMIEAITGPEGTSVQLDIIDVRTGNHVYRTARRTAWD